MCSSEWALWDIVLNKHINILKAIHIQDSILLFCSKEWTVANCYLCMALFNVLNRAIHCSMNQRRVNGTILPFGSTVNGNGKTQDNISCISFSKFARNSFSFANISPIKWIIQIYNEWKSYWKLYGWHVSARFLYAIFM